MTLRNALTEIESLYDKCQHLMPIEWHKADKQKVEEALDTLKMNVREVELEKAKAYFRDQIKIYTSDGCEKVRHYCEIALDSLEKYGF